MKQLYFLLILFTAFTYTGCRQKETAEKNSKTEELRTPEEDQQELDKRLAFTNKKWDSLQGILNREDLEETHRDSVKKLFFQNRDEQEELIKSFILEFPDSEISASKLDGLKFSWGKEVTRELFDTLTPEIKESETGQRMAKFLKFYKSPETGDAYTDFELPNLKGEKIRLSEKLGEYTLLEFWASWCGGCRKDHPKLIKIYKDYNDKGFTVIGISGDNHEEDWKTAVEKDKLPWLNLRGAEGRESVVQYKYGIHYLPSNFLIGPDGKIIAKDVSPEELEKLLKKI